MQGEQNKSDEYIKKQDAIGAIWRSIDGEFGELKSYTEAVIADAEDAIRSLKPDDVVPVARCDDAVSRKTVRSMTCNHCGRIDCEGEDDCIRMMDVNNLPSVVRHKKMGKWVLHTYMPHKKYCSECDEDSPYNKRWTFCPNCGAKMDG